MTLRPRSGGRGTRNVRAGGRSLHVRTLSRTPRPGAAGTLMGRHGECGGGVAVKRRREPRAPISLGGIVGLAKLDSRVARTQMIPLNGARRHGPWNRRAARARVHPPLPATSHLVCHHSKHAQAPIVGSSVEAEPRSCHAGGGGPSMAVALRHDRNSDRVRLGPGR